MTPAFSRALTIVAAAVLAFDGAALAAFGWWSGRVMLMLVGLMFFLSSGLLLVYWRWYRRRLDDILRPDVCWLKRLERCGGSYVRSRSRS